MTQPATNYLSGLVAEDRVAQVYLGKGYTLRHTRWRAVGGELDLVLFHRGTLIFCEVKQARTFDAASERVTGLKQHRLMRTAQAYLAKHELDQSTDMRFDVALVDQTGAIDIFENAFI